MKKKVLFVSIAFPPKGDPECIQTGRYFRYMSLNNDFSIDVVTSENPTLFMPVDISLADYVKVTGQLIEIPILESKHVNFLLRKTFPSLLEKPDSKMTFHWQWRKVVKKLKIKPDIVYSRSYPLSSTLMAHKLSKYLKIPWVMHLSDPWTENALHKYSKKDYELHSLMEVDCFDHAASISFTSEKTLTLYKKKYPDLADKMEVFPNVYDPELSMSSLNSELTKNKIRIVYTGGLANTRTAEPFLIAVDSLVKKAPFLSDLFEVIFAGDMDRNNRNLFTKYTNSCITHLGLISVDSSRQLQNAADLLIVIDSKISEPEKAVFFPSKLLDYTLLGRPILAITDKHSNTNDFVINHGGICFAHESIIELSDWLENFITGKVKLSMKKVSEFYSAQHQASRLMEVFKKCLK